MNFCPSCGATLSTLSTDRRVVACHRGHDWPLEPHDHWPDEATQRYWADSRLSVGNRARGSSPVSLGHRENTATYRWWNPLRWLSS